MNLKKIFSIENQGIHKVVTVAGVKLKIKSKKLILRSRNLKEQSNLDYIYYSSKYKYVLSLDTIKKIIINPNIKIISFDIFDTLLYRPCINSTDIFYLIAKKVDKKYNVNFIKLRLNAENLLNQKNANIHDIYNFIQKRYNLDKELVENLKREEVAAEKQLLQVRDDIKEIYDFAIENNKKVIAVSDMYLPSNLLNEILCEKGYTNISKVYVSNEFQARKDDGLLYDVVVNEENVNSSEICHIGDNFNSDYKIALKKHFTAIYYPSIKDIVFAENSIHSRVFGANVSNDPLTRILIAHSLYRIYKYPQEYLKTQKLFSDLSVFTNIALAPVLFYIAISIATNKNVQNNYDKVYFAARDGYLPQIAYDIIAKNFKNCIPSEYLYTSRRAYLPAMYNNLEDWFLDNVNTMNQNVSLESMLDIIDDVNVKKDIVSSLSKEELEILAKDNQSQVIEILKKIRPLYEMYYTNKRENVLNYYSQKIDSNRERNIIFDIGYSGSISSALNKITNQKWDKIYLWQFRKNIIRDKSNNTNTIVLFDNNYELCSINLLLEELFSPLEGSCLGFTEDLKPILENSKFSKKMQKEMLTVKDTCSTYIKDMFKVFGEYSQYLSMIDINSVLKMLRFMITQSPYNETEIFKNIMFPDPIARKCPVTLESKLSNQCYSSNVFNQTAFHNPIYYQIPHNANIKTNKKLGIHLHLYNIHLLNEILFYLKDFPFNFDLIVTLCDKDSIGLISNILNKNTISNLLDIEIITVENRGRDVAPWLVATKKHQEKYDLFCHIHSKESVHLGQMGIGWRRYLYDNLIDAEAIKNIIDILEKDTQIGIIFPRVYKPLKEVCIKNKVIQEGEFNEIEMINNLIGKMGFERTYCYNTLIFSEGTMFWYNPKALKSLFDLNLTFEDFPEEPIGVGGTIAHAIERMPVYVCQESGYKCQVYNN